MALNKSEILQHLSAEYVYGDIKRQKPGTGGYAMGLCPFHPDTQPSFSFHTQTLRWKCFSSCGSGSVFDYYMKKWDCSFKDCLARLTEQLNLKPGSKPPKPPTTSNTKTKTKKKKEPPPKPQFLPPIPEQYVQNCIEQLQKREKIIAWLKQKRGVESATIESHQIGFSPERRRVMIPVRDENGAIVNIRTYSPRKGGKMRHHWTKVKGQVVGYGSPPRLYGLDRLVADTRPLVVIAEGEWDAILLHQHDFLAVTSTHGAKTFLPTWVQYFANRDVVLMYDADEKGREGAERIVAPLMEEAVRKGSVRSLKVVQLPLAVEKGQKDVTDWFLSGHTAKELEQLINDTPRRDPERTRRWIKVSDEQLRDIISKAEKALIGENRAPDIFVRDASMVTLRFSSDGRIPRIETVDQSWTHRRLAEAANWYREKKNEERERTSVEPLASLARCILAMPPSLPELTSVSSVPLFARSGKLFSTTGYYEEEQTWVQLPTELEGMQVPENPSAEDVEKAREMLLEPYAEFPFATTADQTHAVAMTLLSFVRLLIDGPTPMHLVTSSSAGSGKTLLVNVAHLIATGRTADSTTLPEHEEEVRKKLTSLLAAGTPFVFLDNADSERRGRPTINSSSLAAILTAEGWTDRILGATRMIYLTNNAVWVMTANNPKLSTELTRRCLPIRIVPLTEQPSLRKGFRHEPLTPWVKQNRKALVQAALVLIRSWIARGKPLSKARLGSFESWSAIMGGILEAVEMRDFLGNLQHLYEQANSEIGDLREFVGTWWNESRRTGLSTSDLYKLCKREELLETQRGTASDKSQIACLSRVLSKLVDRVFKVRVDDNNWLEIQVRTRQKKGRRFFLIPVTERKRKQRALFGDDIPEACATRSSDIEDNQDTGDLPPFGGETAEKPLSGICEPNGKVGKVEVPRGLTTENSSLIPQMSGNRSGIPGAPTDGGGKPSRPSAPIRQFGWYLSSRSWEWTEKEIQDGEFVEEGGETPGNAGISGNEGWRESGEGWRDLDEETMSVLAEIAQVSSPEDPEGAQIHAALARGQALLKEKRRGATR